MRENKWALAWFQSLNRSLVDELYYLEMTDSEAKK